MRNAVCDNLVKLFRKKNFVFLSGDLGFMALEKLRDSMGKYFINAGVAEQNMISVAAGLTKSGFLTWVYSIGPFCYARPFEQIRNDITNHGLPVKIIGNGGGYGYGSMGPTHHALEDYGVLLTLKNMEVYIPAFADDISSVIHKMALSPKSGYLRLGKCEKPKNIKLPPYAPWRRLVKGNGPILLVVGPIVGELLECLNRMENMSRPELWVVSELPLESDSPPNRFVESLSRSKQLCVVEEHVAHGGIGHLIAHWAQNNGIILEKFQHLCANGYKSGYYGSQSFHRAECGIDVKNIFNTLGEME